MKKKLNKCIHCGGWSALFRRHNLINYRCVNKNCPERIITDDYEDTIEGKKNAQNEWNSINPDPAGGSKENIQRLNDLCRKDVTILASSAFFSFSLNGIVELSSNGNYQLSTGIGNAITFRAEMVLEVSDNIIRLGFSS